MGKLEIIYEHGGVEPPHKQICMFKCADFTTTIVGRYDITEKSFYVERADGTKYWYRHGIEWHTPMVRI